MDSITKEQIDACNGLCGVYFIQDSHGYIRIGIDGNFPNRLGTHQSSNSQDLKLIQFFPLHRRRYRSAEEELFSKYVHLKHRGSFYKPEILGCLDLIKEMMKPYETDPEQAVEEEVIVVPSKPIVVKKTWAEKEGERRAKAAEKRRIREAEYSTLNGASIAARKRNAQSREDIQIADARHKSINDQYQAMLEKQKKFKNQYYHNCGTVNRVGEYDCPFVGQRFGLLMVKRWVDSRPCKSGGKYCVMMWECQCDCGAVLYATWWDLVAGKVTAKQRHKKPCSIKKDCRHD